MLTIYVISNEKYALYVWLLLSGDCCLYAFQESQVCIQYLFILSVALLFAGT